MDRSNRLYPAAVGLAFGFGGSAGTVLIWAAAVWAVFRLVQSKIRLHLSGPIVLFMAAGALYWLSAVVMAAGNPDDHQNLNLVAERLIAFGIILFHGRLAHSRPRHVLSSLQWAGALGALGCGFWAVLETFFLGEARAAGAAGNPGPFATVSAVMFALSLAGIVDPRWNGHRVHRLVFGAAVMASCLAVLASGMRGLVPALLLGPLIFIALHPAERTFLNMRVLLVVLLALSAAWFALGERVNERFGRLAQEITVDGLVANPLTSLGQRVAVWSCALQELPDVWLTGDGRQDAQEFMGDCTTELTGRRIQFTHFHNAGLNALMYGGMLELVAILGLLLAPLAVVLQALRRRDGGAFHRFGAGMVVSLVVIYALNGATNLMFGHDILDSMYIYFMTAALSVLQPPPPQGEAE